MDNFKTPQMVRLRSALQDNKPLIPESPLMHKIGYGAGNFVFLLTFQIMHILLLYIAVRTILEA
jgi:hypothetical protein